MIQFTQEPSKLYVHLSESCESKIRTACQQFPNREWSGAAFYKISYINGKDSSNATIEDIKINVIDFCLQDIGSSTYTEYDLDSTTASYMADHFDTLEGVKIALLHSHNSMAAFFSTTDLDTLKEQASQCNNVLSLIVNNDGNYVAKFTQKEDNCQVDDVTTDTVVTTTYSFLGENNRDKKENFIDNKQYITKYTEIKIYDCIINRPLNVSINEDFKKECISLDNLIKSKKAKKNEDRESVENVLFKNTDRHPLSDWLFNDYNNDKLYPYYDADLLAKSILFLSLDVRTLRAPRHIKDVPIYHVESEVMESFIEAWFYYFFSKVVNTHEIDTTLSQVRIKLKEHLSSCVVSNIQMTQDEIMEVYDYSIDNISLIINN